MRAYRQHIGTAIAFALSLSAHAADAAVTVGLIEPTNAIIESSTIPVHATASSPEDIYYVEAEFEGLTIELTPTEGGHFQGAFDLGELAGELAYGPHVVTVHAYSTLGEVASAQGTVHRYAPPTLGWNAVTHDTLTDGWRFAAKCIPTPPYACKSLRARFQTDNGSYELLAEPGFPVPQPVPGRLYVLEGMYDGRMIPSGRTYTLTIEVDDYIGPTITKTIGPIYVERSPRLTAVQRAPGTILDFDAARILFRDLYQRLGIFDRATQQVTWVATIPQGDLPFSEVYGALTPSGSVHQSTTGHILAWVNNARRTITSAARLDAVNGDNIVWTTSSDDWAVATSLSAGTSRTLWRIDGSRSPFQADITPSGGVYFGTYEGSAIVGPSGVRLGDHEGNLQRPITDGTNVAGRWWDGMTSSSYLYTAEGEEVFLGDSITGTSAGLLVHAGHAAFLRSDGAVNQVWLRTPDGEQHQISDFTTSSQFDQVKLRVGHDGISDTGEVLFLNGGKRYLGRAGGAPETIGSSLGHGRWLDGSWYVTIGNTIFRVSSPQGAVAQLAAPGSAEFAPEEGLGGEREVLSTSFAVDEVLDEPMWARDLHEPDALPASADADTDGGFAPAAAGCSTSGPAGSAGSAAALAAAVAGLVLGRRRRARS
ncbi:MYXO-CTERM sorting domain-containing protein [Sorangium sp. So ce117]|uniref:MYXO-CTERM sorting domain-containing protein n=1 Tax=Sorangium sp. So ce117 TaxID=3133277 RepID=UPI003F617317